MKHIFFWLIIANTVAAQSDFDWTVKTPHSQYVFVKGSSIDSVSTDVFATITKTGPVLKVEKMGFDKPVEYHVTYEGVMYNAQQVPHLLYSIDNGERSPKDRYIVMADPMRSFVMITSKNAYTIFH